MRNRKAVTDDMIFTVDSFHSPAGMKWLAEHSIDISSYIDRMASDQLSSTLNERLLLLYIGMFANGHGGGREKLRSFLAEVHENESKRYEIYKLATLWWMDRGYFDASEFMGSHDVPPEYRAAAFYIQRYYKSEPGRITK
jgi:hypothetical protein